MRPGFFQGLKKRTLMLIAAIVVVAGILIFLWETNKYHIAKTELQKAITEQTDSLYMIKYDSLYFDVVAGKVFMKNIHVTADTFKIREMRIDDMPVVFLDIHIESIIVTGVQTDKAIGGNYLIGDSVIINHPLVSVYFGKPITKSTKVDIEAKALYQKILGNMKLIKVSNVIVRNAEIKGADFFTGHKAFDCLDANVMLHGVMIDSIHNMDTTRTLFCKGADLHIGSFNTFKNDVREFSVSGINFSGQDNFLTIDDLLVNSVPENKDSSKLLEASKVTFIGIDANRFVKSKNILLEKVTAKNVTFYEGKKVKTQKARPDEMKSNDTSGFRHAYSIDLKLLQFPTIKYVQHQKEKFTIGTVGLKIREVNAPEIIDVQNDPFEHSKEVEISCDQVLINSKKKEYRNSLNGIVFNSLTRTLNINSFIIKPNLGERAFAGKSKYQRDRYDVVMSRVLLKGIDLHNILDQEFFADELRVQKITAKIYRDLQKELKDESKVGKYPSQLLAKLDVPINVKEANFYNGYIEYKEREALSDTTGSVKFSNVTLSLNNVTNVSAAIKKNDRLKIKYSGKALGQIPLTGVFDFKHADENGDFIAKGNVGGFDAKALNKVSIPMGLVRINTGEIDNIKFDFKGNNNGAGGHMVMKYHDLKIDVLKKDDDDKVKKKGIMSLLANIIVINDNPRNGELRKVTPAYERDTRKSFFNLVWKTIFVGLQKTVGMPQKKR